MFLVDTILLLIFVSFLACVQLATCFVSRTTQQLGIHLNIVYIYYERVGPTSYL